mgnify:FL=1
MTDKVITATEAARIYKAITGHRRCPKCIEADAHQFPRLGHFDYSRPSAERRLKGINQHAWEYFVNTRLATRGQRQIFSVDGDE